MKYAVMTGPGKLEILEKDIPACGDAEVLVKISAVGICTWEQKFYRGVPDSYPFIGGHEITGVVEKVGVNVAQDLKPGDHVVVASLTRCGECYYCRRGMDNMCENTGADSNPSPDGAWGPGGFSEYFVARGYEVYKIAEQKKKAVATLAEPLACVIRSMDRSRLDYGDCAVILGGGVMGMLHLLLAKEKGVTVIVSEPDAFRRETALSLGADYAFDPLSGSLKDFVKGKTDGRGADTVFFTAGGKSAVESGIESLVKNGTMIIYGGTGADDIISLDPGKLHYEEIYLTGVTKHTKETFRRAAALISKGNLPLDRLITEVYPFAEIEDAFKRAGAMDTFRVALEL